MIDWDLHLGRVAETLGLPATLTLDDTGSSTFEMRMIDATSGQAVGFNGVDVSTIAPSAYVRLAELAANEIALDQLDGSSVTLNGKAWRVVSHEERPAIGEVQLTLEKVNG